MSPAPIKKSDRYGNCSVILLLLMILFLLSFPAMPGRLNAQENSETTTPDDLESSIFKQSIPEKPVADRNQEKSDTLNPDCDGDIPDPEDGLPSIPVVFVDGLLTGTLSPRESRFEYDGNKTIAKFGLGIGYFSQSDREAVPDAKLELAVMLGKHIAIGSVLEMSRHRRNLSLSGLWQLPGSGFRLKAYSGYLYGNELFEINSASTDVDLGQFSYALSIDYIIPDNKKNSLLQAFGLSLGRAQAFQQSGSESHFSVTDEDTPGNSEENDRIKLEKGRFLETSAHIQLAVHRNIVVKGSFGYEQLAFPQDDNLTDLKRSAYKQLNIIFEPFAFLTIGTGYKAGQTEHRIDFSAESGNWLFSVWRSYGQNGIADNHGAMLSFRHVISSGKRPSLAERMRRNRLNDTSSLLADALEQPASLPQTFLARTAAPETITTASTDQLEIRTPTKTVTADRNKKVFLEIGTTGTPALKGITRNGIAYANSQLVSTNNRQIIINTGFLPAKRAEGDTFVITITDETATAYHITVLNR